MFSVTRIISSVCSLPLRRRYPGAGIVAKIFSKALKIDLKDAEIPNGGFKTFSELFTRKLTLGSRPINQDSKIIVSPVDGQLTDFGNVDEDTKLKAKGNIFTVTELIGNQEVAKSFSNSKFIIIHLSPFNYHRIHMPQTGKLIYSGHKSGALFAVSDLGRTLIRNVFKKNERIISVFQTQSGKMAIIKVGAFIVGTIKTNYKVKLNSATNFTDCDNIFFNKGDEIGLFDLGSTVVLLFENNKIEITQSCGNAIYVGQALAKIN